MSASPGASYDWAFYARLHQVVQAPGVVVILTEWNHTYRIIRLDGRPHVGSNIQLWMGDSVSFA